MTDTQQAHGIDVEDLYRRYGPMVLRRCRRLLADEEKALDAMQDVFVRLLRYDRALEDRGLSSLCYRIATQVCLNKLRGYGRRPEDANSEVLYAIATAPGDEESQSSARNFLARLFAREPESTRVIATLHYVDGMTLEEVAAEVGMSVSGVRKRLRTLKERVTVLERGAA